MKIYNNCSLLPYNTFGIDVKAHSLVEYASVDELQQIVRSWNEGVRPDYLHIGGGSNLLFLADYAGVVLHSAIGGIEIVSERADEVVLKVGAAQDWDEFVDFCVKHHYCGLENLSLIPGEVGACAVQNIGAYGEEAYHHIVKVTCVDLLTGELRDFSASECEAGYRTTIFKHSLKGRYAVVYVSFGLSTTFRPNLDYGGIRKALLINNIDIDTVRPEQVREVVIALRKSKLPDPKVQGNAGSFFMNPVVERSVFEAIQKRYPDMPFYEIDANHVKIPAGWMIEQCGWKGRSMGRAGVHDKQALVLVNKGGATGREVQQLSDAVCQDVYQLFGVSIHPEVNFIG